MSTMTRDETIAALAGFGVIAAHAERICDVAAQYGQNSIPVSDGIVDVFAVPVPAGHPGRPGFRIEHANSVAAGTAGTHRLPASTPAARRSPRRPEVASPNARHSRPVTAADQLLRAAMRPAPAAALHAECSACGFEFSKPQRKGTCNVKAACDKRAAARQGS